MIEYIKGEITEITPATVTLETNGGIGYLLNISLNTYTAIQSKKQVRLYVHEAIREDAWVLFGFATKEERERELEAGRRVLERQLQIELQAARAVVNKHMLEAVQEWRKSKGGVVLAKAQVLDYSPKFDITDTVIKSMDKTPVQFNALPVVSFKDKEENKEKSRKK
jgi:hypothetical protein